MISLDYKIGFIEGEYHLYVIVGDECCAVLHSSYHYKPCYEAMVYAKAMQKLGNMDIIA